ncbi:MAG: ATP-binding protein [Planctomycetes bacterium]|nr:ATP-binding protein [Planctomycetota bacterium]
MFEPSSSTVVPRHAIEPLQAAIADSPVVLVHGPRQCGKTTLVQVFGGRDGREYFTFDDAGLRAAATEDPTGFVARLPTRVALDEIQLVPQLFSAIKASVDRDRQPGRFLLTGSTNVLLLPRLSDSLAGRMAIQRLRPLSRAEIEGVRPEFLDCAFAGEFPGERVERLGGRMAAMLAGGGFPAALQRKSESRRVAWYLDYVETIVQRDIRQISRIAEAAALPRLLELAAGQTARLLNVNELAAPFHVSRPTIRDYTTLLARVFLIEELPPWFHNRLSRLVKTPKLHMTDTGLACALLGVRADGLAAERQLLGQMLESFVLHELRCQCGWRDDDIRISHFRDRDGGEVDFVLERGRRVVGVEVKAGATVSGSDFNGLRKLQTATKDAFAAGIVLHDGERCLSFGDRMFAVPLSLLWRQQRGRGGASVAREAAAWSAAWRRAAVGGARRRTERPQRRRVPLP